MADLKFISDTHTTPDIVYYGEPGRSGYSGIPGESGYSGYIGESGFSGYSGASGRSGYSGYLGDSGFSGYSGISGFSAYSGISGYSGTSGFSGYSGKSGFSGYSGTSGFSGYSGKSGFSGYSGKDPAYYLNVKNYGAAGDGVTDDYAAIQACINAATTAGTPVSGVFFPPGIYKVETTLIVPQISGFRMQGSGSAYPGDTNPLGTMIMGSGLSGSAVLEFAGTSFFTVKDLSIFGNTTTSLTGAAKYGILLNTVLGNGSGVAVFENINIFYCDQGFNAGDGGLAANAADLTFIRCGWLWNTISFRSEDQQQVNYGFRDCTMSFTDICFDLSVASMYCTMLATTEAVLIANFRDSGPNAGTATFAYLKCEGGIRTKLANVEVGATNGLQLTFIDPCMTTFQTTGDGGARLSLRNNTTCKVFGGINLCGEDAMGSAGPLFDLDGTGGPCSILVEGCELPDDPGEVVGTVDANCVYRIRNCFNIEYNNKVFIADYGNLDVGYSGFSGYSGASGFSGYSGKSGFSGYSGIGTSGFSGYSGISGASGISGFSGYSGPSGFSGYSGPSGFSGYSGISGFSGYSGASGFSGYSGPSGFSGYSGPSGFSGYSGPSGFSGYSGPSGFSGYSGPSGFSGYSGISGFSGYSGISGFSGYSGPSGFSGYSGPSGFSGYSGISGASGFSGYSGIGTSGFSGYSGPSGFSGYSGPSGFSGYSGPSGFSGYSGISGFSGYSGISGFSGYSGKSGFSGYSGPTGWTLLSQAADQTVNNQATLQNSNTMTFAMTSGVSYRIRGRIYFDTTAAADFKYGFSQPTNTLLRAEVLTAIAGGTFPPAAAAIATTLTTSTALTGTGTTGGIIACDIIFLASSTASFTFQFSQNTQTNDTGAIVRAGSYLEYAVA